VIDLLFLHIFYDRRKCARAVLMEEITMEINILLRGRFSFSPVNLAFLFIGFSIGSNAKVLRMLSWPAVTRLVQSSTF
jgi:hypothetical protein